MTALQDWLSTGPMNPQTMKSFVFDLLRVGTTPVEYRRAPKIMRPGVERC
ncbi:hypothetical protein ACWDUN_04780 [Mycobacterium sp. NPDC003323]